MSMSKSNMAKIIRLSKDGESPSLYSTDAER